VTDHHSTSESFVYVKTINWADVDDVTSFNCTLNGVDVPTQHLLDESSNSPSTCSKYIRIDQSNLATGRVASHGGRPTHSRRARRILHPYIGATWQILFARWRQWARPSSTRLFRPTPLTIQNDSLIGSAVFARRMPYSPYTLHCASLSPKIASYPGVWTPSSTCFFDPPTLRHPIRHLHRFGRFSTIHAYYQRTDWRTDGTCNVRVRRISK